MFSGSKFTVDFTFELALAGVKAGEYLAVTHLDKQSLSA